jgi:hypothetical protein
LTWRSFLLKEHIEVIDFLAIHFALQNKIRMGASIQHPDFIYNLFGKEVNGGKRREERVMKIKGIFTLFGERIFNGGEGGTFPSKVSHPILSNGGEGSSYMIS